MHPTKFFAGAQADLERIVRTHLFVICPNNSGSTFLSLALAACRSVWRLADESRKVLGFAGPTPRSPGLYGTTRIWAAQPRWRSLLANAAAHNWPRTRKAWYFQAIAQDPQAPVFVAKAAQDICVVDDLSRHFRNARFIFMVRNPYAMCEGVCRYLRHRASSNLPVAVPPAAFEEAAARHAVACLELQRRNVKAHGGRGVFFSYEEMCAAPERCEGEIRALAPPLDDLKLRQRFAVHGRFERYDEPLTDMNARQIARLTPRQFRALNRIFRQHEGTLASFGYRIMEHSAKSHMR